MQLPLHLPALILNGKNTGSSQLTLTTCSLVLHSWLFIEIELNEFAFVKSDKSVNSKKKTIF